MAAAGALAGRGRAARGGGGGAVAPAPARLRAVWENLMCGAVARFAQNATMYPVDTIKTRVQVARGAGGGLSRLRAAVAAGKLYRGLPLSLAGNVPYGMVTFGLYETLKTEVFGRRFPGVPKALAIVLSACVGDAVGSLALTPSEVIKSKTQAGLYASTGKAVRAVWGSSGVKGFYQGYGAALSRDLPFRAVQLSLYESSRARYSRWVGRRWARAMTPMENLVLGAVIGSATAATTTPLDVVRTRVMSQVPGKNAMYRGTVDCFVKTVSNEGLASLYKGVIPRVALIGPSAAVFFASYEAAKSFFRKRATAQAAAALKAQ